MDNSVRAEDFEGHPGVAVAAPLAFKNNSALSILLRPCSKNQNCEGRRLHRHYLENCSKVDDI